VGCAKLPSDLHQAQRRHGTGNTPIGPPFQGVKSRAQTRTTAFITRQWLSNGSLWLSIGVNRCQLGCWPAWCAALTRRGTANKLGLFRQKQGCGPRLAEIVRGRAAIGVWGYGWWSWPGACSSEVDTPGATVRLHHAGSVDHPGARCRRKKAFPGRNIMCGTGRD
jgi:hypothetical protein